MEGWWLTSSPQAGIGLDLGAKLSIWGATVEYKEITKKKQILQKKLSWPKF